jgi:hypothetical protein
MPNWNWKYTLLAMTLLFVTAGCDSNPTNEPTADAVQQANVKRAAAIDADPSMTPEQKKKMKEMLHLDGGTPGQIKAH